MAKKKSVPTRKIRRSPKGAATTPPPAPSGALPVCIAMVLCDQIIIGSDRTTSAIRIVDTIHFDPGTQYKDGGRHRN